jgi:hypothetical protein
MMRNAKQLDMNIAMIEQGDSSNNVLSLIDLTLYFDVELSSESLPGTEQNTSLV